MNGQLPLRFPLNRSITIIGTCTPNKTAQAKKQPEGNWKMHVKIFCILLTEHEASIIVCSLFRVAAAVRHYVKNVSCNQTFLKYLYPTCS